MVCGRTWLNSEGPIADGGAGRRPDAAICMIMQIGQSSSGRPLGICVWSETGDALPTDVCNICDVCNSADGAPMRSRA